MKNYSDHKKPSSTITALLPEVYKSDVNTSVLETSFDRFLTKDDSVRVAGYIGQGNPEALVDRQIKEVTPHRQAYQLAPTMVSTLGTDTSALSFNAFQSQLDLMGVDINRMADWASTLKFNWVPPVNIDMLVNYSDYFWVPQKRGDNPQYLTIENTCSKATSAATAFMNVVQTRGVEFDIVQINFTENQFVINDNLADVFTEGLKFGTTGSTTSNRLNKAMWMTVGSTFVEDGQQTIITVFEPIATVSTVAPTSPIVDQWWYNPSSKGLFEWTGSVWNAIILKQNGEVSLAATVLELQKAASCACHHDIGWDMGPWDSTKWDFTDGCAYPADNPWTRQNKWVHKSEVQSIAGAKRATVPILEYSSLAELNSWVRRDHGWKYRAIPTQAFSASAATPQRFELEPVKGYVVASVGGKWNLYLFSQGQGINLDIDYTETFVPGYRFVIRDDALNSETYTTLGSVYREITSADPAIVTGVTGVGMMCTIVTIDETSFSSPVQGGGSLRVRLEPTKTSQGDTWGGYHAHWVADLTVSTATPVAKQQLTVLGHTDTIGTPTYIVAPDDFVPADVGTIAVGYTYQQFTVTTSNVTRVTVLPQFLMGNTSKRFALANSDQLRVYVNGQRQYFNYTEETATYTPAYTSVGNTTTSNGQSYEYVTAINFVKPLVMTDVVRMEFGPIAYQETGWNAVPVRTVEDETAFTLAVIAGTQPVYANVTQYAVTEQQKTEINQYPMFNVYDVITGEVIDASALFTFTESEQYPISTAVQRRIVVDSTGKEYGFTQHLVDRSNNVLYGYRDTSLTYQYWYNPMTNTVKCWIDGFWSQNIPVVLSTGGIAVRSVLVADVDPVALHSVDNALWFNTTSQKLFARKANKWVEITDVVINAADPTLRTVWRHGTNYEQFTPQYVDKDRTPVPVGSADGDWGVVDQWMYNSEHKNYKEITYSQLVTHFNTIIQQQPAVPGLPGRGAFALAQAQYNYGLGGTIHDYNDSFDTLISAVNVTNVTPIGVIEYAAREYSNSVLWVRDTYSKGAATFFTTTTTESIINLSDTVASQVITKYESNDYLAQLYGDSSAFNQQTKKGVRNWIATAPMFGLSPLYQPHLNVNGAAIEVFNHDGHRTPVSLSVAEYDRIARSIISAPDDRVAQRTFGVMSNLMPPSDVPTFVAKLGQLRTGVYWYRQVAGIRTLYRFVPYQIIDSTPTMFDANGTELPDGTMYYNTQDQTVYVKAGLVWNPVSTGGDVTALWTAVDLTLTLGQLFLEIEQRLFDVTTDSKPVYDFATLRTTPADQTLFNKLMKQRFITFVTNEDIRTPFVNNTYNASNAFTWNYKQSIVATPPVTGVAHTSFASWQALYQEWYGTPYPNMEPWTIQGYVNKPVWWDEVYADKTGTRTWTAQMWTNLLGRIIPVGKLTPSGIVSTGAADTSLTKYAYFSVNTTTDQLLPPYVATSHPVNRSLFNVYANIVAPNADYVFGDVGPVEWAWLSSGQHPYDNAVIAFQMQPMKFLHSAFGPKFALVDSLQVETLFKQVYSHEDALFHGDLYDGNVSYYVNGLNQWYVNYNRYTGYDTNNEFRQLWAGWEPKQTYQFGGIVDTSTFEINNPNFDVVKSDYSIVLANSGVVKDQWVDAFAVSLINIPPAIVQYNNQAAWRLDVDTLATVPREISYYGVKAYPFVANVATNVFTAFNYKIVHVDKAARRFYVDGDQTAEFIEDRNFVVTKSSGNNGQYSILSSVYETNSNRTRINVGQAIASVVVGGEIDIIGVALPWSTGDQIVVSSTQFLPAPLLPDTPYYIIVTGERTFQIAELYQDSLAGVAMDITTVGNGALIVAQLDSSFFVFGGGGNSGERWYHYALNKQDIRTFTPPTTIQGMQSFINMVDGYAALQKDRSDILLGVADVQDVDTDTGRQKDWMVETERFINWAYGLRQSRMYVNDSYVVTPDTTTNTLTYADAVPFWRSGTMVTVRSTGSLPTPLIDGAPYFVVTTGTQNIIRLSVSSNAADMSAWVDLTDAGTGTISVGMFNRQQAYPQFEMNPCRNNIVVSTPFGVLANVIEGPYTDIRVQQTIFDQYNRPLTADDIAVFRQDERSRIIVMDKENDVDPVFEGDPYNTIHIGGAHLFIEGYEHFLLLNDYTVGNALVYDQFYGLWTRKFEVDYFEKEEYNLRPTLGGYYLINGEFKRNIEGSVSDVASYYDTSTLSELSEAAMYSRRLLGYKGGQDYMTMIGANSKSQFLFYKGMIQTKGSLNSVKAYTNSRRFLDANVDEFWAYKVADFGDNRMRVYPEVKLFSTDSLLDDVRLEFLAPKDIKTDPMFVDAVNNGFQLISFADDTRWNNFPEQRANILSPLFLDGNTTEAYVIYAGLVPPPPGAEATVKYWLNTNSTNASPQVNRYDSGLRKWVPTSDLKIIYQRVMYEVEAEVFDMTYLQHAASDDVRVLRRNLTTTSYDILPGSFVPGQTNLTIVGDVLNDFTVGVSFAVIPPTAAVQVVETASVIFNGNNTVVTLTRPLTVNVNGGTVTVYNFNDYTTETLLPGTGVNEYTRINSENIRFDRAGFDGLMVIFTINPSVAKINPAKLIDTQSNVVVQQMPLWHPALGIHSPTAIHNVTIQHSGDPASYEFTLNPTDTSSNFWNQNELGQVWLDTSYLGYTPYYDDQINPDINDRLFKWGKLAPWGDARVFKWVETTIPPSEWDKAVVNQANNMTIAQNDKATGTPYSKVYKRTRQSYACDIADSEMFVPTGVFTEGQSVLFADNGKLPDVLQASTKYVVASVDKLDNVEDVITLRDPYTEDDVVFNVDAIGLRIIPTFTADMWVENALVTDRLTAAFAVDQIKKMNGTNYPVFWPHMLELGELAWSPANRSMWNSFTDAVSPDVVDVYINSELVGVGLPVTTTSVAGQLMVALDTEVVLNERDIIDIVRSVHVITEEEAEFDPDGEDDGTTMVQWKADYSYSTRTKIFGSETAGYTTTAYYYYWVYQGTTREVGKSANLSTLEIEAQLKSIPTSYFVVQRPMDDPYLLEKYGYGVIEYGSIWSLGVMTEAMSQIPVQYRECILRKVSTYLTDNDRFIARFTRDWTLRDNLTANGRQMNLKDKHEEWQLFRRDQPGRIPKALWDSLTNSVVGYRTANVNTFNVSAQEYTAVETKIRVPSLERELYDAQYGTETQYGLGKDQTFVKREYGLATILNYLTSGEHNFWPMNIDLFFASNDFTTPEGIRAAMNQIYNSFPMKHVNGIWFEVLSDALATKSKYKELMKTSWLALHGVRQLDVNGQLDD